ncbi:MAG: methyltransferase, partial [Bacteroidales bacterium]|nr:methyltransferase [Bacteroidales bacterium]
MNTLEDYCAQHTSAPDKVLNDIYRSIALHTANPHMSSTPYQGTLLHMLTRLASPTLAVEVGSFAGYGAICIARGMRPGGTLHVIE